MRLVCPNCSAQYEIDATMIPEDGRDVQCSNCGHTWFELPGPRATDDAGETDGAFAPQEAQDDFEDDSLTSASTTADALEDADLVEDIAGEEKAADSDEDDDGDEFFQNEDIFDVDDEAEDEDTTSDRRESHPSYLSRAEFEDDNQGTPAEEAEGAPEEDEQEEIAAETAGDERPDKTSEAIRAITAATDDTARNEDDLEEDEPSDLASMPAPRRPADAAALDILREEAEREMSRRRAPPSETIETQTDLGLEDIRNRRTPSRALRARMAHLGEEMPPVEEHTALSKDKPEAVISRPSEPEGPYEEPRRDLLPDIEEINSTLKPAPSRSQMAESRQRSGFRVGFLGMVFAAAAIVVAYAQAPAIARALPEAEPTVIAFVDKANGVRDWIDGLIGD